MNKARERLKEIEEQLKDREKLLGIDKVHTGSWNYDDILKSEKQGILLGLEEYKSELILLQNIRRYIFDKVTCTAGVYCENLEKIRKMFNKESK